MLRNSFCVVLVEDNPADAEIFRMALAKGDAEIKITHFETGAEVLAYFGLSASPADEAHTCDMILLDLNLPKISGFEILQRMRSADHLKTMPIVIMSGSRNPDDRTRSQTLGATSYISKPSSLADIYAVADHVTSMLRERR